MHTTFTNNFFFLSNRHRFLQFLTPTTAQKQQHFYSDRCDALLCVVNKHTFLAGKKKPPAVKKHQKSYFINFIFTETPRCPDKGHETRDNRAGNAKQQQIVTKWLASVYEAGILAELTLTAPCVSYFFFQFLPNGFALLLLQTSANQNCKIERMLDDRVAAARTTSASGGLRSTIWRPPSLNRSSSNISLS